MSKEDPKYEEARILGGLRELSPEVRKNWEADDQKKQERKETIKELIWAFSFSAGVICGMIIFWFLFLL